MNRQVIGKWVVFLKSMHRMQSTFDFVKTVVVMRLYPKSSLLYGPWWLYCTDGLHTTCASAKTYNRFVTMVCTHQIKIILQFIRRFQSTIAFLSRSHDTRLNFAMSASEFAIKAKSIKLSDVSTESLTHHLFVCQFFSELIISCDDWPLVMITFELGEFTRLFNI